jgi:dTDP-4-amino-4,6-dideoxygalactose transaminase
MRVEFFRHSIDEEDIARLAETARSVFLTTGPQVEKFENALGEYLGGHAVAVTSCTAAMHLCLLAWEIGPDCEVITTPLSFCATANVTLHTWATPVFVDVEEETGNIDADLIEGKITGRTRAIMPVHLYGQMCDMRRIRQIAKKHKLIIIEDAAHCVEGVREGILPGQFGNAACFSFYATKNITSGEGGAIVTDNRMKADLLKQLRLHGIDESAADRYTGEYRHYDMGMLGWKYNMDDLQASLLIGQLERIDELWNRREIICRDYEMAFAKVEGIRLIKPTHDIYPSNRHARHLFTIQVAPEHRDAILHELQKKDIGVAVHFRPIHLMSYYRERFGYKEGDFPVAERIGASTISLPLYPRLTDEEVEYVIKAVKEVLASA